MRAQAFHRSPLLLTCSSVFLTGPLMATTSTFIFANLGPTQAQESCDIPSTVLYCDSCCLAAPVSFRDSPLGVPVEVQTYCWMDMVV
jgi:hypothetical protein